MVQRSPFAPAAIDFSGLSDIGDTYRQAQDQRMRRDALAAEHARKQSEVERQNDERAAFRDVAQGLPAGPGGEIDWSAAAAQFGARTGNVEQSQRIAQMGGVNKQTLPAVVQEYQFYAQEERAAGRTPMGFKDFRQRASSTGGGRFGVTPLWMQDADGRTVAGQLSNTGELHIPQTPAGYTPLGPGGIETAKTQGKGIGQARVDLPKVEAASTTTLGYIDRVLNDPNLGNVTGWQANLPTFQSRNVDAEARIAQLSGRAFLSAFESLKGAGQITEIEGQKATEALARLTNLRQSDAGFRQALEDFKTEVKNLVAIARQRAAGSQDRGGPRGASTSSDPLGIR